jgi:hypothetical protein
MKVWLSMTLIVGVAGCSGSSWQPATVDDLRPLWTDKYQPLSEGLPPWPRGIGGEQMLALDGAYRIIVAVVDPEPSNSPNSFHRHKVLTARECLLYSDEIHRTIDRLIAATRDIPTQSDEFYPKYAVRVYGGDVVDVLVSPDDKGMYVMTEREQRYCVIDSEVRTLFEELLPEAELQ